MPEQEPTWVDIALSRLLRGGVLVSVTIVMVGIALTFVHHPEYFSSRPSLGELTQPGSHFPNTMSDIVHGVAELRGQAVVMLGLLLLIATPVARVALSILIFIVEKDRLYTAITIAVLIILLISFFTGRAEGAQLPPIPPLPEATWPAAEDAVPFARALIASVPPRELAQTLHDQPDLLPRVLRNLGTALMTDDRVATYLAQVARATPTDDMTRLAAIVIVDPLRYEQDADFRKRMNAIIPRTLASVPDKKALLDARTPLTSADFEAIDGGARHVPFTSAIRMPDDSSPIEASIYSLTSDFFSVDEAQRFLDEVHKSAPKRTLLVVSDLPLTGATIIDAYARPFTPWPRDPFIVGRENGRVVFINRPNTQRNRAEDQNMSRDIVQQWPGARWTVAPFPFHNGHILLTPDAAWISMHSVEPRVLQLAGLQRVPVESFDTPSGVERYLSVVKAAARELEQFYGRPVRFVHAMDISPERMKRLSGGAGYDLDSVLTILPNHHALVGDLRQTFAIPAAYNASGVAENAALQTFLDEVASELQRDGMTVHRLPLIDVPAEPRDFLITWNNVVLDGKRAEGFGSLIAEGDAIARKEFAAAGYKLTLFAPLIRSIVLGGGYRCASNHVRARSAGFQPAGARASSSRRQDAGAPAGWKPALRTTGRQRAAQALVDPNPSDTFASPGRPSTSRRDRRRSLSASRRSWRTTSPSARL